MRILRATRDLSSEEQMASERELLSERKIPKAGETMFTSGTVERETPLCARWLGSADRACDEFACAWWERQRASHHIPLTSLKVPELQNLPVRRTHALRAASSETATTNDGVRGRVRERSYKNNKKTPPIQKPPRAGDCATRSRRVVATRSRPAAPAPPCPPSSRCLCAALPPPPARAICRRPRFRTRHPSPANDRRKDSRFVP